MSTRSRAGAGGASRAACVGAGTGASSRVGRTTRSRRARSPARSAPRSSHPTTSRWRGTRRGRAPTPFADRLGREERLEEPALHARLDAGAGVADLDDDPARLSVQRDYCGSRCRRARPSGIACAALTRRFRNTWPAATRSPSAVRQATVLLRQPRAMANLVRRRSAASSRAPSGRWWVRARTPSSRASDFRSRDDLAHAIGAFLRGPSSSPELGARRWPRARAARPRRSCAASRFRITAASGLLISCATPAASVPTAASRSATMSCASSSWRSAASRARVPCSGRRATGP